MIGCDPVLTVMSNLVYIRWLAALCADALKKIGKEVGMKVVR